MTARNYVCAEQLEEVDTERSLACSAIQSWWGAQKEGTCYPEGDEITTLELVNSYQSKLCTLLGVTVQQETELSLDLGLIIIKEPIMGSGERARVTLNYCYPKSYVPYKVWVSKGRTTLGFEAYSTGDLIARIHNAYCLVEMFGEGRPYTC